MMFLTQDEIKELTGRKRHASQAAMLNAMGIAHKQRGDGKILALKNHVEKVFGGGVEKIKSPRREPDFSAIN
jgi:Domain of unknown function (DUF4224)